MDMLIKLHFICSNSQTHYHKEFDYIIDENSNENLGIIDFIFNEYNKLEISFESTDVNTIIEVDNENNDETIKIHAGSNSHILCEDGDYEMMLSPGYYSIKIVTSIKTYYALYFITPTSFTWQNIIDLKDYIDHFVEGLSQNLYIQRNLGQRNIINDKDNFLYEIYNHIKKYKDLTFSNIESIIKNPILDIKKEYKENNHSVKPDSKSQRWLNNKGMSKNQSIYIPNIVYEKHTLLTNDVIENKWVKKIISKIVQVLCDLEYRFGKISSQRQLRLDSQEKLFSELQTEIRRFLNDKTVGEEHKYNITKQKDLLHKELEKLNNKNEVITEIIVTLNKTKTNYLHFFYETWLDDISNFKILSKPTNKIFRDYRYLQLYEFYQKILSIEISDLNSRTLSFPSKKTSKLFEYYALLMVINIIRGIGYTWESGWLGDSNEPEMFNGEIPSDEKMIFIKENLRCEIVYEKKIQPDTIITRNGISDFVRINISHYEPDIIVSLFDNQTNKILKSFIVEVKCRKKRNMLSRNGPTSVIEQVKDYYQIGYYDKFATGRNKTKQAVIKRVIVVYPMQDEIAQYTEDDFYIPFVQLCPDASLDLSTHIGYLELKEEIDNFFTTDEIVT